ncbi:DUF1294 domain-containing protein [Sporosarcina sp. 179-K 3D1 HS]|uniref:DUF1294 domain-containing protein n=1 Tax=Sporosarcina sp. 179-K 3D1 HS TaxID=3232169 RepID=UPI0039A1043A
MQLILLLWIFLLSLWAFFAMRMDKRQAKRRGQRVPERNLWLLAILGGGIGAYFGMQVFRHKTRHTNFRIGFLLLAIAYAGIILYLFGFTLSDAQDEI